VERKLASEEEEKGSRLLSEGDALSFLIELDAVGRRILPVFGFGRDGNPLSKFRLKREVDASLVLPSLGVTGSGMEREDEVEDGVRAT
jgi:hypothetical protein